MSVFYSKDHEWVALEGSKAKIGISDYAVHQLGDITYVELPEVGAKVKQFEVMCTIESVKAVSDVFAPVSGKIVAVNDELNNRPELVNESPEQKAWIAEIEISSADETKNLMTPEDYKKHVGGLS